MTRTFLWLQECSHYHCERNKKENLLTMKSTSVALNVISFWNICVISRLLRVRNSVMMCFLPSWQKLVSHGSEYSEDPLTYRKSHQRGWDTSTWTCSLKGDSHLICSLSCFWRFALEGPCQSSCHHWICCPQTAASLECTSITLAKKITLHKENGISISSVKNILFLSWILLSGLNHKVDDIFLKQSVISH